MRNELKLMIARKSLVRKDTPETDLKAEKILQIVEKSGGLTPEEVLTLSMY